MQTIENLHALYSMGSGSVIRRTAQPGQVSLGVFDIDPTNGPTLLAERLRALPLDLVPDIVVLRDLNDQQLSDIESQWGAKVEEIFAGAGSIATLSAFPHVHLNFRCKAANCEDDATLLGRIADLEVWAILWRAKAMTTSDRYHFRLSSGAHTDMFVRVGDSLTSSWAISRICDWVQYRLGNPSVLVLDTSSLIPIAQELHARALARDPAFTSRYLVLPLYEQDDNEVERHLSMEVIAARRVGGTVAGLVSVTATGGWLRRFEHTLEELSWTKPSQCLAICDTSSAGSGNALAYVPGKVFASEEECDACNKDKLHLLRISASNLSTKLYVGVEHREFPTHKEITEVGFLARSLDKVGAIRVHVDDPQERRHLGVCIDIPKVLTSAALSAQVELAFARLIDQRTPDLVAIPEHSATGSLQQWITNRIDAKVVRVPKAGALDESQRELVRAARSILIFDDCVISGRTIRATLDTIQRLRLDLPDFWIGALVVMTRTDQADIAKWLRDRFFINSRYSLEVGWTLPIPSYDRNSCPWCIENAWLRRLIPRLNNYRARQLAEERLSLLHDGDGMTTGIFLGSSVSVTEEDRMRGTRTTPNAYIGDAGDAAVFTGVASAVHRIRQDWAKNPASVSRRLVFPLAQSLGRYTDPVIAASILRVLCLGETEAASEHEQIPRVLRSIAHQTHHPVHLGELILAANRRLISPSTLSTHYVENLVDRGSEQNQTLLELLEDY